MTDMDASLNSFLRLFVFTTIILATFAANTDKWKHRKLTTTLHGKDLAYVEAVGLTDTLHYLYSGQNELSILAIKSTTDGKLIINQTESPPTIELEPAKSFIHSFGMVFSKLIEYNDTKDAAHITTYKPQTWKNHSTAMDIVSAKDNKVVFQKEIEGGNVTFSFQNSPDDSRQDILPHLSVNSNLTLIDFIIDGVKPAFDTSRFALDTSFMTYGDGEFNINSEKSIDDEYTPGTFEVANWVVLGKFKSFLQWKPVSYFGRDRKTKTSTYVRTYKLIPKKNFTLPSNASLVSNYFDAGDNYNMTTNFISFGRTDDKFYNREKYTAWAATIGYGAPPAETVSTMAIIIISIGLGLPVLLFIGGGIYLCVKRRRSEYQPVFGTISS